MEYKDTLNLPKTNFSMKANLPQREPEILKKWQEDNIYAKILASRKCMEKVFILHDGPPYANGHIHMGHVLNKMLKDICVKYFTIKGFRAPFVPGWDCHGLPVEHQLFKELGKTKNDISQSLFRKKAHDYAMKYVKIQAEEFKRLGVFGDWENPYLTLSREYESEILFALADLYEKGFIYKDLKPVNWCKTCETALAEAEVEYEDKTSPSIYVKFKTKVAYASQETFFVIWTTTPWTLVANTAVALHPEFTYSFVETGREVWIMADKLVPVLMKKFGIEKYNIAKKVKGNYLAQEEEKAYHPFIERESRVVLADYVTAEEGTACVHTAPGHGQDDYITAKKYGLEIIMPVESTGKFGRGAGKFSGQNVFEANDNIIKELRARGALIKVENITHSYPHCWRCKEPIIFRATEQWFMNVDHHGLRARMLKVIKDEVEWIPDVGRDRIVSMIEERPDWCLSRQRYWGVPIPAFICTKCGETFTNSEIIRKVAELTKQGKGDVWFEGSDKALLVEGTVCRKCGGCDFKKENNILDVWFDSGVSYRAVLEKRDGLSFPADLYLEGSDQHRGWFQSALITAMAVKEKSPYRKVLTHGFVVDGEGKKMSKSLGNVINPQDIMKKYGADILRLWTASSDYEDDIKLSPEILERLSDGYRKIRNTFRFLLSNLYDFDPCQNAAKPEQLSEIDRWMLSRLKRVVEDVERFYEQWAFYKTYRTVYNFCVYEISAFYLDVVKDVLYADASDSEKRRSVQTVIFKILHVLVRILSPILSFTVEEVWDSMKFAGKEESVHMAMWPEAKGEMKGWKNKQLDAKWEKLLVLRDGVMKLLEIERARNLIGSSLEAAIIFYAADKKEFDFIKENAEILPSILKVSHVKLAEKEEADMMDVPGLILKAKIKRSPGEKCRRCWNYSETVGKSKNFSDLCERCSAIIKSLPGF